LLPIVDLRFKALIDKVIEAKTDPETQRARDGYTIFEAAEREIYEMLIEIPRNVKHGDEFKLFKIEYQEWIKEQIRSIHQTLELAHLQIQPFIENGKLVQKRVPYELEDLLTLDDTNKQNRKRKLFSKAKLFKIRWEDKIRAAAAREWPDREHRAKKNERKEFIDLWYKKIKTAWNWPEPVPIEKSTLANWVTPSGRAKERKSALSSPDR